MIAQKPVILLSVHLSAAYPAYSSLAEHLPKTSVHGYLSLIPEEKWHSRFSNEEACSEKWNDSAQCHIIALSAQTSHCEGPACLGRGGNHSPNSILDEKA
jgi:hypothetical protein